MEKERLLTYSSEQSPVVIRLNEKIYTSRQGITNEILGIRRTLGAREQEIKKEHLRYDSYISDIPRREREYADKLRQQRIKESLYVVLLEKKEEANLSLAVTAPSAKVIEDPLAGKLPIAPNKMLVMLVAVLVGLAVPLIIFLLKENLNYKIETDMDVKRLTNIPLLASLPLDKKKNPLVVNSQSTTPIAEMFRLLRTNLQFALGAPEKKIVLITSSISGEGKTFVSINLAVTFALKYKTILIGLDIRKPKLANYMNLSQRQGIVSYLNGDITDVDSIIQPSGVHENLDVIAAGPVPPNPNELLMERSLDRLFAELRNKYEYIIVDTSPVGSVSDSFLLDRISDVSLFVLRSKITPKAGINLVNNIYEDNRLKKLQLVLNGVSDDTNLGQYGYGRYGYGYGYGYGYNNEKEGSRKRKKK
jgi:capsular exopolysaccharide synthesis family protein